MNLLGFTAKPNQTCACCFSFNNLYLHVFDFDSNEEEVYFTDDDVTQVISARNERANVQTKNNNQKNIIRIINNTL